MKNIYTFFIFLLMLLAVSCAPQKTTDVSVDETLLLGDDQPDVYMPMLQGKRVALFSNQTGLTSDGQHVLDALLANRANVTAIFSPEHGFRGTADAGEHVNSGVDEKTGVPILSLYDGEKSGPSAESMSKFDVLVVPSYPPNHCS